jgi:hypothetical protein
MPNGVLRRIYKIRFSFFAALPAFGFKVSKKCNNEPKIKNKLMGINFSFSLTTFFARIL